MKVAFGSVLALLAGCSLPANLRDAMVDAGAQQPEDTGVAEDAQTMDDGAIPDTGVATDAGDGGAGDADVVTDTGVPAMCTAATVPTVIAPLSGAAYATQFVTFTARVPAGTTVEFEWSASPSFMTVFPSSVVADASGVATTTIDFPSTLQNVVRFMRARAVCAGGVRGTNPSVVRSFRIGTRTRGSTWARATIERMELDADADGRTDLAMTGEADRLNQGTVRALRLSGTVDTILAPTDRSSSFGRMMIAVGDTNDDGFGDLLVGDPFVAVASSGSGRATLHRGSFGGLLSAPSATISAGRSNTLVGVQLASLGDINDDGLPDFAVAGTETTSTQIAVFASPFSAIPTVRQSIAVSGFAPPTAMIAGDLDGDGYSELVVGFAGASDLLGEVLVFRSTGRAADPFSPTPLRLTTATPRGRFGMSLAMGAYNNDGALDLIVGAPGKTGTANGALFVYPNPFEAPGAAGQSGVLGLPPSDQDAGKSIVIVGDRDGDGNSELLVLHPGRMNPSSTTIGAVWLLEATGNSTSTSQAVLLGTTSTATLSRGFAATGGFTDTGNIGRLSFAITRDTTPSTRDVIAYTLNPPSPNWTLVSSTLTGVTSGMGDRLVARASGPSGDQRACAVRIR